MTNPLNSIGKVSTIKEQMEMPVQVVSAPSVGEVTEVESPVDLSVFDNAAEAVVAEKEPQVKKELFKGKKTEVTSRKLTQEEINEITGADLLDASIIARPLSVPEHLEPKTKDPNMSLRWVQIKAQGGVFYEKALSQGFRNATRGDLQQDSLKSELMLSKDKDDKEIIKYHDTILMIIPKRILKGAYAYNIQKSTNRLRGASAAAKNLGRKDFQNSVANYQVGEKDAIGGVNEPIDRRYANSEMVEFYTPSVDEVSKKLG